jgi:thioredoxin-like negative regulator of GroEL
MLVPRRWSPLPAVLLLLALPAGAAKGPEWIEGRSNHFHIYSDAKQKQVEQLTRNLEDFRHLLHSMLPSLRLDPPIPTTVLLFKNANSLKPYLPLTPEGKPKKVNGYFLPGHERMYLMVDMGQDGARNTAFHEYVHLVMALNVKSIPVWLNEGLAEFYEQSEVEDGIRFKFGFPQKGYWQLLQGTKLIPLDVLVEVDHKSDYYNVPNKQTLFYAQSWALVHYLMTGEKGRRQTDLTRFVNQIRRGTPQQEAFEEAFGEDYASMQRRLKEHLKLLSVMFFQGKLDQATEEVTVEFQPIEAPRAEGYLADIWITSGRLDEAEAALKKLAASDSAGGDIQFRLGRIALERQRPSEAAERFRAALAQRPDDIALRYYTALALTLQDSSQPGSGGPRESAEEIIELLSPLLEQKSDFPDAYELLVRARLARNDPPEEMIPLLERVRELLPQKRDFDLLLAFSYLKAEQLDAAEKLLLSVVDTSKQPHEVAQAKEWLGQIAEMREWETRRQQWQSAPVPTGEVAPRPVSEETPRREIRPSGGTRTSEPVEPPPTEQPRNPPRVEYLRGTLVNVACSDDAAVITVQPEAKRKEAAAKPVHLAVQSRTRILVIDSTDSGKTLECGAAGTPVGVNYVVQPEGPTLSGIVMTIEFLRSLN